MPRRALVLVCVLLTSFAVVLGVPSGRAFAAHIKTNFVVVAATPAQNPLAIHTAERAGGRILQSWPAIGVSIVESSDPQFAATLRGRTGILAAGATRAMAAKPVDLVPEVVLPHEVGSLARPDLANAPVDSTEPDLDREWALDMVAGQQAHRITSGERSVTVGVMDSGIDARHLDLIGAVDPNQSVGCTNNGIPDRRPGAWLPTSSGHGTHVAGLIAASRNGLGMVGVAPNVRLASIKVVDEAGFIYPEYALCGIMWAAEQRISVTNHSYFIDPWNRWCYSNPDQAAVLVAMQRAVSESERQGVLSVASVGNDGVNVAASTVDNYSPTNGRGVQRQLGSDCLVLPAGLSGVVSVAAVGPTGLKSFYSNYGRVSLAAPGGDGWLDWKAETPDQQAMVYSTLPNGEYGTMQGTSMAAPMVTGVAALVRSVQPSYSPAEVRRVLAASATVVRCPVRYDYNDDGVADETCVTEADGHTSFYGAGLVNARRAVTTQLPR